MHVIFPWTRKYTCTCQLPNLLVCDCVRVCAAGDKFHEYRHRPHRQLLSEFPPVLESSIPDSHLSIPPLPTGPPNWVYSPPPSLSSLSTRALLWFDTRYKRGSSSMYYISRTIAQITSVICSTCLSVVQVGLAFLAGVAFCILLIPVNRWLAVKIGQLSTRMMADKDNRVKACIPVHYRSFKMWITIWIIYADVKPFTSPCKVCHSVCVVCRFAVSFLRKSTAAIVTITSNHLLTVNFRSSVKYWLGSVS